MIAVARFFMHNEPQPPELKLALQSDRWGVLPDAGGLRDQEAGLIDRMSWASAVHNAFRGRLNARNVIGWIDANPEAYELYAYVKKLMRERENGDR